MKQHTCRNKECGAKFVRQRMGQLACCPGCAIIVGRDKARLDAEKAAKAARANTKNRKEAIKSRPERITEAQAAFNAFIRARDLDQSCICCGKPFEPMKQGGSVDAGHYLSRGSAPHLRFDERNCFAQRKNCNRPGGTTRAAFRAGVQARIGIEALEALESDQAPRKWTDDDLIAIKNTYIAKRKQLLAERGN